MSDLDHNDADAKFSADEQLLQRYVDGELRSSERGELEERLVREPELGRRLSELASLRKMFEADRAERVTPLGVGFADRVWAELRETAEESVPAPTEASQARPVATLRAWTLIAASVAILLGAALLLWKPAEPVQLDADNGSKELRQLDEKADAEEAARERKKRAAREK